MLIASAHASSTLPETIRPEPVVETVSETVVTALSLEETIKAGDTSTTTIKAFIEEQAVVYGVKPELATAIARAESSFVHNAKNPKSSASGVWQFITSTAQSYCVEKYKVMSSLEEKDNPVLQTKCALNILKEPNGSAHWDASKDYWKEVVD